MRKTRVLIVDDSVVVRRVLVRTLSSDPAIEVVGTAPNGRVALAKIAQSPPDLIILDLEMPEMDGLKMLAALRKTHPLLPVILFSVFVERKSATASEALAFPAVEYVTKPPDGAGPDAALKVIRDDLIPKIKMHSSARARSETSVPRPAPLAVSTFVTPIRPAQRVDLLVIGVSTGGPDALGKLLPYLPGDFPVPILIVQHMPPVFTKLLAGRLAAKSRIRVAEATADQALKPGHAWLAPGDYHMKVERIAGQACIRVNQDPPENSCRPSVDVLFRSAAEIFGCHVLAVVMTGMGQDGLLGCQRIREVGGRILVQDEASSVVWGMPRFVALAGLVDQVLPLRALGPEIVRHTMALRHAANPAELKLSTR